MTSPLSDQRDNEARSRGALEHRQVFLSHSHSDRKLSEALQALVASAYSGLVEVFTTADVSPAGGLQPGDEWYTRLHAELVKSESVWVLATETSIARPWVYWEAGVGRALCTGGVVVLRVGLGATEVPPPLSALQSYDGLNSGPDGIGTMLSKIADRIGMSLDPDPLEVPIKHWLDYARTHKPDEVPDDGHPMLAPEQFDRLEQAIVRIERAARQNARDPAHREQEWLRSMDGRVFSLPRLNRMAEQAPVGVSLAFDGFDSDGDARFFAMGHGGTARFYVADHDLEDVPLADLHPRVRSVVTIAREQARTRDGEPLVPVGDADPQDLPF